MSEAFWGFLVAMTICWMFLFARELVRTVRHHRHLKRERFLHLLSQADGEAQRPGTVGAVWCAGKNIIGLPEGCDVRDYWDVEVEYDLVYMAYRVKQ